MRSQKSKKDFAAFRGTELAYMVVVVKNGRGVPCGGLISIHFTFLVTCQAFFVKNLMFFNFFRQFCENLNKKIFCEAPPQATHYSEEEQHAKLHSIIN